MTSAHDRRAAREAVRDKRCEACETDDVSLIKEAILMAKESGFDDLFKDLIERSVYTAFASSAIKVLEYLLDNGADVTRITYREITAHSEVPEPSLDILQLLVDHGWDINTQGSDGSHSPILWTLVRRYDLTAWALEHGARIDITDDPRWDGEVSTSLPEPLRLSTILDQTAGVGTVETFDLLRAAGASFSPAALHLAVQQAVFSAPRGNSPRRPGYIERIRMIRHLLVDLRLDANAVRFRPGHAACTPLGIVATRPSGQDYRDIVSLLLDHGGDIDKVVLLPKGHIPPSAAEIARSLNNRTFFEAVEDWQAKNSLAEPK